MPKFNVSVKEIHDGTFIGIEAKNADEAKQKAGEMLDRGEEYAVFEYSHTLDPDVWTVEEHQAPPLFQQERARNLRLMKRRKKA